MKVQKHFKSVVTRYIAIAALMLGWLMMPSAAAAQTRLVVRDSLGLPGVNLTCALLGC